MKQKSMSVRFESELLHKIGHIARGNEQSINTLIVMLIRRCIKAFEEQHGEICTKNEDSPVR